MVVGIFVFDNSALEKAQTIRKRKKCVWWWPEIVVYSGK